MPKSRPSPTLRHEKTAKKKGFELIAGIDEAGRGPLAGPVVASAVIIKDHEPRFACEINDSKLLSPKKRILAYHEILKKAAIGIGIIDEDTIDSINIRRATILAMEEAVINLGVEPDLLLIDGIMPLGLPYKQKCIIRGDAKSVSIAAASIVAKVIRDSLMLEYHKLYPQYRFDLHKGYGTKTHIRLLKKHGPSPIHRTSFKVKAIC